MRVAHLGASESFSARAALRFAHEAGVEAVLVARDSPAAVLDALERGEAELAVLPIANSSVGLVRAALEALVGRRLVLAGEVAVPVDLVLWVARADVGASSIERVASHPMALRQCARALARLLPGFEPLAWSDTASAARALARGELDLRTAVLAAEEAGLHHGLHALARDVQDEPDSRTFFALLRRADGPGVD